MTDATLSADREAALVKDRKPEDFSLFDPAVQSDPYAFYEAMHKHCPVYREPEKGYYVISDYADLKKAILDTDTYSNNIMRHKVLQTGDKSQIFQQALRERGWEPFLALQRADPPEHRKYRKIIDRVLNAKHVLTLVPRIEEVTHQLIDRFIDRGECEFIDEFAFPLPGTIIAEQIGLDAGEIATFKKWADNNLRTFNQLLSEDEMRAAAEIELEMQHYLHRIFQDRLQNPRSDIISYLVNTVEGEEPLTVQEQQAVMNQIITGGYETVISALAHGMWQMIRFPHITEEVRADRSLVRNFINESLRFESPVQGLFRMVRQDTELGGTQIPKDSVCITRYGAANRDPAMFDNPHEFDLHREKNTLHLAFGTGIHFCPGANLARHEMTAAYNAILDRMADIQLAEPMPEPAHSPSLQLFPLKQLKIKFRKIA